MGIWVERNGYRSRRQVDFLKRFTTLDHIGTLGTLIEEDKTHKKRIYYYFENFLKKPLTL